MKISLKLMVTLPFLAVLALSVAATGNSPAIPNNDAEAADNGAPLSESVEVAVKQFTQDEAEDKVVEVDITSIMDPSVLFSESLKSQVSPGSSLRCVKKCGSCFPGGNPSCCAGLGCYLNEAGTAALCLPTITTAC